MEFGNIVPGVFTPVLAKHSKSFSLIDCVSVGVDRMQRNFESMRKQVEAWQRFELHPETCPRRHTGLSASSLSDSAILRQLRVPPGHRRNIGLFGSQCLHRIEARCTPRGNDTCERGHREQRCGNCCINRSIKRLDLIEQVAH
jgi:hypothetical protein